MGKRRVLEDKVDRLLEMFPVVAIVGPRQCGKSTLVRQMRPGWHYYDLESPDDYQIISSDPVAFFTLIDDTGSNLGMLVNRGWRFERLTEQIIQLPVNYL